MVRFRKVIFWIHLVVGVVAGLVILVMCVTGMMLAYQRQMTTWADGGTVAKGDAARLGMETLLTKVRNQESNSLPGSVTLRAEATAPTLFAYGRDRVVLVNPYTGEILGAGGRKARSFFQMMTNWHRWLGTNENGRAVGRAITGGCNLAFLFMVVSGFYLWWPRNWTAAAIKGIVFFNRGLKGKAREWNWHNAIGFWCLVPLFAITLTGVVMSFPWANNIVYRLTGSEMPSQRAGGGRGEAGRFSLPPAELDLKGLDKLWAKAEKQFPGWQAITLRLPASDEAPVVFTIDRGNGGRPDLRSTLTLNRETSDIVRREDFDSYNTGRKVRTWFRWIHTGEAGGIIGQTVAMAASAGGAMLVWTGLSMAGRRILGKKLDIANGGSEGSSNGQGETKASLVEL